jgi:hypothetical protein
MHFARTACSSQERLGGQLPRPHATTTEQCERRTSPQTMQRLRMAVTARLNFAHAARGLMGSWAV